MGGLSPYDGLVRVNDPWNNDVPGFSTYWDGTHSSAEPTDDLTNAVLFAAGGVGAIGIDSLRLAASEIAGSVARSFGVQSTRTAVRDASAEAFEEALGLGRGGAARAMSMRERLGAAREAGYKAAGEEGARIKVGRAELIKRVGDVASRLGVKIPDGLPDVVANVYQYSTEYKYQVIYHLLELRAKLAAKGAVGAAAVRAIDELMRVGG
jgi:hypothetical protein